jgi:hypothetical protein
MLQKYHQPCSDAKSSVTVVEATVALLLHQGSFRRPGCISAVGALLVPFACLPPAYRQRQGKGRGEQKEQRET